MLPRKIYRIQLLLKKGLDDFPLIHHTEVDVLGGTLTLG